MRKVLCLIVCYFLITTSIMAKTIQNGSNELNIIQISGIRANADNTKNLSKLVDKINANKNIDFVIFTGENISKPDVKNLNAFLDTIKNIKTKKYVLLGKNDVSSRGELTKTKYMSLVKEKMGRYHSDCPHYVIQKNNITFIILDGSKGLIQTNQGYYKEDELTFLDEMLTKYSKNKVIIVQHFPLLDNPDLSYNLYKKDEYMKVLEKHNNVIAVISGHYKNNIEEKQNGIYHIVTPAFSDGYYKEITIYKDNYFIFTQLCKID